MTPASKHTSCACGNPLFDALITLCRTCEQAAWDRMVSRERGRREDSYRRSGIRQNRYAR